MEISTQDGERSMAEIMKSGTLEKLAQAVLEGAAEDAKRLTEKALSESLPPNTVLVEGLSAGMTVVGGLFRRNEMFIPEVLLSARAMRFGMEVLRPLLAETGAKPVGKVILGTVAGDLHDIGKDIVHMMLEGAGFQVFNLGINVEAHKFIEAFQEHKAPVIALSALLSTTMPQQKAVIEAFEKAGLRGEVKILIGGAPVTQEYADKIGADGFAPDAASAVLKAKELLGIS